MVINKAANQASKETDFPDRKQIRGVRLSDEAITIINNHGKGPTTSRMEFEELLDGVGNIEVGAISIGKDNPLTHQFESDETSMLCVNVSESQSNSLRTILEATKEASNKLAKDIRLRMTLLLVGEEAKDDIEYQALETYIDRVEDNKLFIRPIKKNIIKATVTRQQWEKRKVSRVPITGEKEILLKGENHKLLGRGICFDASAPNKISGSMGTCFAVNQGTLEKIISGNLANVTINGTICKIEIKNIQAGRPLEDKKTSVITEKLGEKFVLVGAVISETPGRAMSPTEKGLDDIYDYLIKK